MWSNITNTVFNICTLKLLINTTLMHTICHIFMFDMW